MTGLGNYSRTLVKTLAAQFPAEEFFLYTPGWIDSPRLAFLSATPQVKLVLPQSRFARALPRAWRSFGVRSDIRRAGLDIFHGLSNELPFGIRSIKAAKVVTIHDLIFRRYPHYYAGLDRRIYDLKSRYACRTADVVVAVSEQTKRDIIEFYGIATEKIKVIYQSCDRGFSRAVGEAERSSIRARYNLPAQFVLYVGSIEERKNLMGLVKAVESLRKSHDLYLVALGRGTRYKETVEQYVQTSGLDDRVQIRSDIDFTDFPAVYQMAQAFVYPSYFEGFGIPIIEALWSKTPVITSRRGCFAEAGGPTSRYVSPDNPDEIADAISQILGDSSLRAKMIAGGYSHAQRFREEIVTRQMMDLYIGLIKR